MNVQGMKGSVGSLALGTLPKGGCVLRVGIDVTTDPAGPDYSTLRRLVPEIGALLELAAETAEEEPAEGEARVSRKSELFVDGSRFGHGKDHRVKFWGLPPSARPDDCVPEIATAAASIGKKVSILFGTNDHAKLRIVVSLKGSMIPDLTFRQLNSMPSTDVWLDMEELQKELNLGEEKRGRGRPKKSQPQQLPLAATAEPQALSRSTGFGALAAPRETPNVEPERRMPPPSEANPPSESEVVGLVNEADGDEWQDLGIGQLNTVHVAANGLTVGVEVEVPGSGSAWTAWGTLRETTGWWILRKMPLGWFALPIAKRAAPEEVAAGDAFAPKTKEELSAMSLDDFEGFLSRLNVDQLAAQFEAVVGYAPENRIGSSLLQGIEQAVRQAFVPLSDANLRGLGDGIQDHLAKLTLEQLREQWQVLTGKQSRATVTTFLARQIVDHLAKGA